MNSTYYTPTPDEIEDFMLWCWLQEQSEREAMQELFRLKMEDEALL